MWFLAEKFYLFIKNVIYIFLQFFYFFIIIIYLFFDILFTQIQTWFIHWENVTSMTKL